MVLENKIISLINDILSLDKGEAIVDVQTPLFGEHPSFDSMAVVSVLTEIEQQFGIEFDDDEISADIFETVDSLISFVKAKI